MRSHVRVSLVALIVSASVAVAAPAAQAAFGVAGLFASNCQEGATCTATSTEGNHSEIFTQAAGHPPQGVTDFTLKSHVIQTVPFTAEAPEGNVKNVRTDVGPGESTNPESVTKCSVADFTGTELEPVPGLHAFTAPNCPGSEIGMNRVRVVFEVAKGVFKNFELEGKMYNLEQPPGLSAYFGIALSLEPILGAPVYVHTFLEGHIEWGKETAGTNQGDYHDIYIIKNITPGLISSRINFKGNIGTGGFLTLPSSCTGTGPQTTTTLHFESYEGESVTAGYSGPLGTEGCKGEGLFSAVPFKPGFLLESGHEESQSDLPDGVTTELSLPHDTSPTGIDSSQLENAVVTLPEGMTLNPSAAHGLEACTAKQARIHSEIFGVECPSGSKLGTVSLNVPDLPAGSLTGNVYLGGPESGPIRGGTEAKPEYTMYVNAESKRYGVDTRLEGTVTPNPTTGQVTATFVKNPEQPFSNVKLTFNGGALAPIANPLTCGTATSATSLTPYTGTAAQSPGSSFTVDGDGKGGACASPLPFALSQSTVNQPPGNAGAKTSYTLNLERADGQQYLSQVRTVLPAGLVGLIPTVPLCGEPQASKGECSPASQIGVVEVKAGAGPTPFGFAGQVYLTGPYNGAPFGLTIETSGKAGPFDLGSGPCDCVLSRGTLEVEPYTARVIATSSLPTIVKGVPLRLRKVTVNMNRQGFLINPTSCGVLATETTLTSTLGAKQTLSSPFQVGNCKALAFKPKFGSATGAKTSKANGASLETTINMPAGDANIRSVLVQLPKQLPSRLSTLQKACPEATFAKDPNICPPGSFVGGARANTPTLPGKLTGPAILVSHGGQAFPDLDLVMSANGVRVILVGNTTTNFAANPDVPVSSITVNLPTGAHSALAANGNLCANKLVMPTTMVGQNGSTFKQSTTIKVKNCPVRIAGRKVVGNTAYLSVQTYSPGRISGKGNDLATVFRNLSQAQRSASLKVPLSSAGRRRGRPFSTRVRVGFVPKKKGAPTSVAYATVRFG
jgi:hypothetical protein